MIYNLCPIKRRLEVIHVLITYDIKAVNGKSKNKEVKDGMKAIGYKQTITRVVPNTNNPIICNLPNTTLVKDVASPEIATADLQI